MIHGFDSSPKMLSLRRAIERQAGEQVTAEVIKSLSEGLFGPLRETLRVFTTNTKQSLWLECTGDSQAPDTITRASLLGLMQLLRIELDKSGKERNLHRILKQLFLASILSKDFQQEEPVTKPHDMGGGRMDIFILPDMGIIGEIIELKGGNIKGLLRERISKPCLNAIRQVTVYSESSAKNYEDIDLSKTTKVIVIGRRTDLVSKPELIDEVYRRNSVILMNWDDYLDEIDRILG